MSKYVSIEGKHCDDGSGNSNNSKYFTEDIFDMFLTFILEDHHPDSN